MFDHFCEVLELCYLVWRPCSYINRYMSLMAQWMIAYYTVEQTEKYIFSFKILIILGTKCLPSPRFEHRTSKASDGRYFKHSTMHHLLQQSLLCLGYDDHMCYAVVGNNRNHKRARNKKNRPWPSQFVPGLLNRNTTFE